jgi:hypothetical protein
VRLNLTGHICVSSDKGISQRIVKRKGHVMNQFFKLFCCSTVLSLLFAVEVFSAGPDPLPADSKAGATNASTDRLVMPNVDDMSRAPSNLANQNIHRDDPSERISDGADSSSSAGASTQMASAESAGASHELPENNDSSFKYLLATVIFVGCTGFVMIVAGAVQWWRNRSLKNIRLYDADEVFRQPYPAVASLEDDFIDVDQPKLAHNKETRKSTQHRAA